MRKYLLFSSIVLILIPLIIFIFLNIKINKNIEKNNEVLNIFKNTIKNNDFNIDNKYINFSKIEIQGKDYIGVIETQKDKSIPIESKCDNNVFKIKSACLYDRKPFIILVTTLNDSFKNYESYEIDKMITFTDTLGITTEYKIKNIKRINDFKDIKNSNADLIIVVKNYYELKYILILCDFY